MSNKIRITVGRSHSEVPLPHSEDLIASSLISITAAIHRTYKAEAARAKKVKKSALSQGEQT